ncbi:glycosyltransferase family 4 protein [Jatrophihabitans sp.]|uniref:glycosyltransferase family 4 protein n=1 Tax=Jatrophihabitans sp. TaxID=1932789 RepID=UPI0030C6A32F|nr:glycosyl transferase [Jatrophihabitans sp.]
MRTTLVVTNDFPPRQGGIQSYVYELARRLPGPVVVYASTDDGAADFDAAQPFPVVRHPTGLLLPTPTAARNTTALLREHGATAVWFGASAPLGLLTPALRRAGAERIVASSHGHETGWARLPAGRQALRRIGTECDVITYITEYTRVRIAPAFGPHATLAQLTPGVDVETFHPGVDGEVIRQRHGLADRPVIVCVSRLVPRKGQDALIRALPAIRRAVPDAVLLLVGHGPYEARLRALAAEQGDAVVFTGGVPYAELPQYYAAGDVFAMPCRTRRGGLDVEGLGMVFLEASATGIPVVAGDSGGAPDAVLEGETGYVVDGRDEVQLAQRIVTLLQDPQLRGRMGTAGRAWVEQQWSWAMLAQTLNGLLQE